MQVMAVLYLGRGWPHNMTPNEAQMIPEKYPQVGQGVP